MAKGKGVSGKTHTQAQLDDYSNQRNPNSKAYEAVRKNQSNMKQNKKKVHIDSGNNLEWFYYGNPFDFD